MAGEYYRVVFSQLFYKGPYLDYLLGVESYRRLVQNQDSWIPDKRLCKPHSLLIALGEVLDNSVEHIVYLDKLAYLL